MMQKRSKHEDKTKSAESEFLPLKFFSLMSLSISLGVGVFWLMAYLKQDVFHLISYWPNDYPGVGKPVGQHYFGDFAHPREYVIQGNPWFPSKLPDVYNYTPLATLLFQFFTYGNYYFSLFLFLVISCACSLYPLVKWWRIFNQTHVGSNLRATPIKLLTLSGVLGSLGFVSVIDRGNYVSWIVPPVFLAFYLIMKNRWGAASFFIAVAASLKIYPALLFMLFVRERKWKELGQGLLWLIALFSMPVILIPGNFWDTSTKVLTNILNWQGSNFLAKTPFNISFAASMYNSAILLKLEDLELFLINNLNFISLSLLLLVCLICVNKAIPFQIICFVLASSLWIIPSLSSPYVCVVLLSAIFLWMINPLDSKVLEHWLSCLKLALLSSLLTMTPFVIPIMINGNEVYNFVRIMQGISWLFFYLIVFRQGLVISRSSGYQDKEFKRNIN